MDEVIRDSPEKTERTEATDGTEAGSQLSLWPEESGPTAPAAGPPETPAPPAALPFLEPLRRPGRWERIWISPAPLWSLADLGGFILFAVFSFFLANFLVMRSEERRVGKECR